MTDAVLALWQHVDQEPADKLGSGQRHDFVPTGTVYTVVLDAEGDALVVHADQSAVGYGDPVRVARQVRQDGFWTGEGFLGVDNPVDFAQWVEEIVKDGIVDETRMITEEL